MPLPQEPHLDQQSHHNNHEKSSDMIPFPELPSHDPNPNPNPNNITKPSLKIKNFSPLDVSSNLEFTHKFSKYSHGKSLANIRPDGYSHSIHRVSNNNSTNRSQAHRSHRRTQSQEPDTESLERINEIVKEISDTDKDLPLYEIWPGNNQFFFSGRLMTGPRNDQLRNLVVWAVLIAVNAVFFAVAVPYLMDQLDSILPILSSYLCGSTVFFFLLTSFTDPGIIPRKCIWELHGEVPKAYSGLQKNDASEFSRSRGQLVAQAENPSKFCNICQIHRPSRTVHCKRCGTCVEVHKGHLRFMNNCIGRRNYKFYIGFNISAILMGVCYVTCFIIEVIQSLKDNLASDGWGFGDHTLNAIFGVIVGIPTVIFFFINLALFFAYLCTKYNKREVQREDNKGRPTADWYESEPSRVKAREIIPRAQLVKYKAALVERQVELAI